MVRWLNEGLSTSLRKLSSVIRHDGNLELAVTAAPLLGDTAEIVHTDRKAAVRVSIIGLSLSMRANCQCIFSEVNIFDA